MDTETNLPTATTSPGNSLRLSRRVLVWTSLVLAGALSYSLLHVHQLKTLAGVETNESSAVESERLPHATTVTGLGKVEPIEGERFLCFDTAGILRRVLFVEGQWVKNGQCLAELVNDELVARVDALRNEVAQKAARLKMLKNGPRPEDIEETRAEFEALQIASVYHGRLVKTRKQLRPTNAVSDEEVLDYQNRYDEVMKKCDASSARLRRLLAGTREEEIDMARADRAVAMARLAEASAALERTRLRAPTDGTILRLLRREGESVLGPEGAPIASLADSRKIQVRAEIDEEEASWLEVGMTVQVSPRGASPKSYEGKLIRLMDRMGRKQLTTDDPREKVDTRVLEVIVELNESTGLRIQQRVDVVIRVKNY